jgi:hypothetical protein
MTGLDLAKEAFQVHGARAACAVVFEASAPDCCSAILCCSRAQS